MNNESTRAEPPEQSDAAAHETERPYSYTDAGIQERHGYVPVWLWGVVVALVIWGIYYTVAYWSPPH